MYNYRILIQYDGGRFDGWQRLGKDASENTVEFKIKEILKKMTGEEAELFCGCRTEKGVHAYGQVANFKLNSRQNCMELRNYLNRYLPRDIAVLKVEAVDERFHSQLLAKETTYLYRIDTKSIASVFERKYSYHTFHPLDYEARIKQPLIFLESMTLRLSPQQERASLPNGKLRILLSAVMKAVLRSCVLRQMIFCIIWQG